jgi:hypothetical protein
MPIEMLPVNGSNGFFAAANTAIVKHQGVDNVSHIRGNTLTSKATTETTQ